jgi:hypothetical protein
MKTADGYEVKKGRIYYRVSWPVWSTYPFLSRVKCSNISPKKSWLCGPYASFTLQPGEDSLAPRDVRSEIFHNFEKAKNRAVKKLEDRIKETEKEFVKLENTTKKDLMDDTSSRNRRTRKH